jgi:hypothetical protein
METLRLGRPKFNEKLWEPWGFFTVRNNVKYLKVKIKAIPITGRRGLQGCEKSRIQYFLENCLTDGGEVVRLTRR